MRILVKTKPNSKKPGVQEVKEGEFVIAVREPATEGKANAAAARALAKHLGVPPSLVRLTRGAKSKTKTFTITQ